MTATVAPVHRRRGLRGTVGDIYHERTSFDFIGRSKLWALLSGTAVLISLIALVYSGLNLGIDFEGGTQWEVRRASGAASAEQVRQALADTSATDAKVLVLGNDAVRVQTQELKPAQQDAITAALAKYAGVGESTVSIVTVGPTWGDQVSRKALTALFFFFILIAAYLTFRFEWKMALSAIIAVVHDIVITVGVYAITGFEVTPGTVVAFLTILGFSLYDTVVVFDKINENTAALGTERGDTYSSMVNRSMNQVLMRSINTSFVALLPVASLLVVGSGILGAATLRDFALALFVGLLVGAYSSIFVATPILAWIKEREPRNAALRERSVAQMVRATPPAGGATVAPAVPAAGAPVRDRPTPDQPASDQAAPDEPTGAVAPADATPPSPTRPDGPIAPRPRRQRRRKRH
ncbi:MAG: protein translocase subunit SecF [Acidimicrobiia bacterium]|jgi:preprotein translocase subunit SecF|nr:protein translocase subunit SecF [Acidimicrobiia bacterium]